MVQDSMGPRKRQAIPVRRREGEERKRGSDNKAEAVRDPQKRGPREQEGGGRTTVR
jgi:hypothetical protein